LGLPTYTDGLIQYQSGPDSYAISAA